MTPALSVIGEEWLLLPATLTNYHLVVRRPQNVHDGASHINPEPYCNPPTSSTLLIASPMALPFIPDNLSIPQFFLDSQHSTRPLREEGIPWLINDVTGRKIGFEEVRLASHEFCFNSFDVDGLTCKLRRRTYGLANAMSIRWNIGELSARPELGYKLMNVVTFRCW